MSNRTRSFLLFAGLLAALYLLSGCRSAQTLMKVACDRDPIVCNPPVIRYKLDAPKVTTSINCDNIVKGFTIVIPREYKDQDGNQKIDSVRASLVPHLPRFDGDTAKAATLQIDCPDPEVIKESYPVIVPPTFWQKLQYFMGGIVGGIVLAAAFWVVKKFIL